MHAVAPSTKVPFVRACFAIAGIPFELSLPDDPLFAGLVTDWQPFRTQVSAALQVQVTVANVDHGAIALPRELPVLDVRADGFDVSGPDYEATFRRGTGVLSVRQTQGRFPVETLVKMLLSDQLAARGGVLLHSVGVEHGGRAGVFVGVSGAGKSTLGALVQAGGLQRLADELVAVVPRRSSEEATCQPAVTCGSGATYVAYGTPWNVGVPRTAALALLGRLSWGKGPRWLPLPGPQLLRLILPNAILVDGTPAGRAQQFRALSALVGAVPIQELSFSRDAQTVAAVRMRLEAV